MKPVGTLTWAERNVLLDGRPFRREDWPQIVDFIECIDASEGKTIIAMMPPQRGKTLAAQLHLARNVAVAPRRALWYSRTAVDSRSLSDAKLKPLIESCEGIRAVTFTDPDARGRGLLFRFHNGPVELLSAEVEAHRNGRSGQTIYLDEAWQYPERAIAEIFKRADSYRWQRQQIITTTAPDEGHELDVLWKAATRHEWNVACPHCGHAFVPVWGQEMFPLEQIAGESGKLDVAKTAASVRMVPPCCRVATQWSLAIQRLMIDRTRGAGYRREGEGRADVIGYRFNALAVDSWESVAAEWATAMNAMRAGDPSLMREFRIKRLCVAWSPEREDIATDTKLEVGPYRLGESWTDEAKDSEDRAYRFLTVDVQRNHFWAVVRSWAKDGRSRLIARSKLLTSHEIEAMAREHGVTHNRWFEHRQPDGRTVVTCESRVFLDSRYSPGGLVPRICADHGFHCLYGEKRKSFKHGDGIQRIFNEGQLLDPMAGVVRDGYGKRIWQWYFVGDAAKDRMEVLRGQVGSDGLPCWTAAEDHGQEYAKQMAAEAKVKKFGADGLSFSWAWVRAKRDNHYFDCETMQIVAASMAGLIGDEAESAADQDPESR
jgi:hypothetical protein